MSLSRWEREALGVIENGLARSDPALASRLGTFSRLARGEEMPTRKKIRVLRRRAARRRSRLPGQEVVVAQARRLYLRLGPQRTGYLLWLVISGAIFAVALTFSTGGGHVTCLQMLRAACGG
jgi:hypothetical protein